MNGRATPEDVAVARGVVSDHALVRYVERVMGFDVEAVRVRMARAVVTAVTTGAPKLKKDGVEYHLRDGRVVTVWTPNARFD